MLEILFLKEAGESLVMYSKQTNLENRLHISTESSKEDFNDAVFFNI